MNSFSKPAMVAGALVLGLGTASPASAENIKPAAPDATIQDTQATYGANWANVTSTQAWSRVEMHDGECDNTAAYADLHFTAGYYEHQSDDNGCSAGNTEVIYLGVVDRVRVCEVNNGCGAWKNVPIE